MANVNATGDLFGLSSIADANISYPPAAAALRSRSFVLPGSPFVIHPPVQGFSVSGGPMRITGRPRALVRRSSGITGAGFAWWWAFIVSNIPTQVYVELYDFRDDTWNVYSAYMSLPNIPTSGLARGEETASDFVVAFTRLVEQTKIQ